MIGTLLHHVNHRFFPWSTSGEDGIAVEIVEVLGNCNAFADECPVVELEDGYGRGGVLFAKLAFLMLGVEKVNTNKLHLGVHPFLCQHDANTSRIGETCNVMDLHKNTF